MRNGVLYIIMTFALSQAVYAGSHAGGASGLVRSVDAENLISYTSKIGDISENGISLIGVVRSKAETEALMITNNSETAVSAVSTDWLGVLDTRLDYSDKVNGQDSIVLYSYTMGIADGDTVKKNCNIVIGRQNTNRSCAYFDMKNSEDEPFLAYNLYDHPLQPTDRRRVESYFAIKYGLTLDQTTPVDYLDSKGDVVWNAKENRDYRNAIAGIGSDNGSELSHPTGSSIHSPHSPVISSQASLLDGMYLVWGHNGEKCDLRKSGADETGTLARVWSISSTGDWSGKSVDISFRTGGEDNLPAISRDEIYWLKVDGSGNGGFDEPSTKCYKSIYTNANTVTFKGVDVSSPLSHMTLAARQLTEDDVNNPFQSISVYPSPSADGNINVTMSLWRQGDVNIVIYNSIGQIVSAGHLTSEAFYEYQGFLPVPGVYILIAETCGKVSTFKVERK